jgi:hypothetical protein
VTDFIDVLTNTPLSKGSHNSPEDGMCLMEKVAILWALHSGQDVNEVFGDLPPCTNSVLAKTAQFVNDALDDADRQRLNVMIPRLLRARQTDNDQRVNMRLALHLQRCLAEKLEGRDELAEIREAYAKVIEATEAWLEDSTPANLLAINKANAYAYADAIADAYAYANADAIADAIADANAAAYAYANAIAIAAAYAYANAIAIAKANANANAIAKAIANTNANAATNAAANANAFDIAAALVALLDGLLDAWEEAITKEGMDLYIPQDWEDDVWRPALASAMEMEGM